ncbi:Universal stress protein E [Halioglobus japonicus]|nr:Universal stress protein E [Halioglobus japonicus]
MAKILIVADLEKQCCATPRGLELAAKLGVGVDVVAFVHVDLSVLEASSAQQESMRNRLLADREREVHSRIDKHLLPGQKAGLTVVWEKDIHRWLNKRCAGGRYQMVVKTGNRSESLVHTSTDWQLLRECPAPVLLVAKKKWHRVEPVLVALDLASAKAAKQSLNHKLLMSAKGMAEALGVGLEIIAAIQVPTVLAELDLVDPESYARSAREAMQPQISKLARACEVPESAFHCKRGAAEKVVASRAAKVRAQLVVMGTVGRKGVRARLLGNTAEKVLLHLKTDVLAIKL